MVFHAAWRQKLGYKKWKFQPLYDWVGGSCRPERQAYCGVTTPNYKSYLICAEIIITYAIKILNFLWKFW